MEKLKMRNGPLERMLENSVGILLAMKLSFGIMATPGDVNAMRRDYDSIDKINYTSAVSDSIKPKPRIKLSDKLREKVKLPPSIKKSVRKKRKNIDGIYGKIINQAASRNKLPYDLVAELIHKESEGDKYAISKKGAKGLMQLMPLTGKAYGVKDFFDPRENVYAGTEYLADLVEKYDGDIKAALTGYNWNPNKVERLIRENGKYWWNSPQIPKRTRKFVEYLAKYSEN